MSQDLHAVMHTRLHAISAPIAAPIVMIASRGVGLTARRHPVPVARSSMRNREVDLLPVRLDDHAGVVTPHELDSVRVRRSGL